MEIDNKNKRKKIILELIKNDLYVPMKEKELAIFLQVQPSDREAFSFLLREMISEKALVMTKRGKYVANQVVVLKKGEFTGNPKGFGFIIEENSGVEYFVAPDDINGALHRDIVEFDVVSSSGGKRQEAKVLKVVERGYHTIIGTYELGNGFGFVVPDDLKFSKDIFVSKERSKNAQTGDKVVVEITFFGSNKKNPEGIIKEVLGNENASGVDMLSIIKRFELPSQFETKVEEQGKRVAKPVEEIDCVDRRDFRKQLLITIDGDDSKDLDDAISLSVTPNGWKLGVHIADVANYVQENSALDREAKLRGTSIYLADRVIPMLPRILSNGICSLNEGEDRLALSCIMDIDKSGDVGDYEIVESVICVRNRMNYSNVCDLLHSNEELDDASELRQMLLEMNRLRLVLNKRREVRGALNFETSECKMKFDDNGIPTQVIPYQRNEATDMIEEFMLLANETVAKHFYWLEIPFVYRVHDEPDPDKMKELSMFLVKFGYSIKVAGGKIHPKELQKLLRRIEGTKEEAMISRVLLRSMKRAVYDIKNTSHFGLSSDCYCHFTSPIRRYPDLQIHRIIKLYLKGKFTPDKHTHFEEILPQVCQHASKTERIAQEAERETLKRKKALFMSDKVGEIYDGIISGVTSFGIYVELENTVEGLVSIHALPKDQYVYEDKKYEIVGKRTKKVFGLGDPIQVVVQGVNLSMNTIDFLVNEEV